MLKLEKIIEIAASRMNPIDLNHQRCSRVCSPLGTCNKCIECCPVEGITIEDRKIELNYNCIQCGLCASVCPTGAISIQEPTELNLYKYMEESGKLANTVILTCKHNGNSSKNNLIVPCLGSLTLEFLLAIDTLPCNVNIVFSKSKCKECNVKDGINHYLNNIKNMERIEKVLNLVGGAIKNTEKVPKLKIRKAPTKEIDYERREFLLSIFELGKKLPNASIKYILGINGKNESEDIITPNPTVKRYPILVKAFSKIEDEELLNLEIIDYQKPLLAAECSFCGACMKLCPMGALKIIEYKGKISLILFRDTCSGCGLCVDVCYDNALKLKPKRIRDFLSAQPSIIATGVSET